MGGETGDVAVTLVGRIDLHAGVRAVLVMVALLFALLAAVFLLGAVVSRQWLPLAPFG